MPRRDNLKSILEFLSIIKGVDNTMMSKFREQLVSPVTVSGKGHEVYHNDFVMQTDGLEFALRKLNDLSRRSKGTSAYIRKALDRYTSMLANLIQTPQEVIMHNPEVFYNLGCLSSDCTEMSYQYLSEGGPNECLEAMITSKDPIEVMKRDMKIHNSIGQEKVSHSIQPGITAAESYLLMCDKCPFLESYHRKQSRRQ